jgi:predicted house-cleaning noncanonical NTP pyrophosphatase (MazG superfamily)
MPTYNKLIRDKIPQIIDTEGKSYTLRTLSNEEYVVELKTKLGEELKEYLSTDDDTNAVEELADLLELVQTLATVHGASPQELEEVRRKKADKRGGFQEKLFLVEVQD